MALTRSQDWPLKLRSYIDAQRDIPFAWATNDCCTSVCGWIKLCTGTDVYSKFAGTYTDEATATASIKAVTGTGQTVEDAAVFITAEFGMTEVSPAHAQRGDIALFDGPLGPMLGIVNLNPTLCYFPSDKGLHAFRTLSCRRSWRVG